MSGDLRAVAIDAARRVGTGTVTVDTILAALAATDEPLVATVKCPRTEGWGYDEERTCSRCHGIGTVRIVAVTEDVLRARLVGLLNTFPEGFWIPEEQADRFNRAIFGGTDD
jgi:hypothetical protein